MAQAEDFDELNEDMKILSGEDEEIEFDVDLDGDWDED